MHYAIKKNERKEEVSKAREQLQKLKDGAVEAGRDAGQTLDDAWITTRIKAALFKESVLDGFEVGVGTEAGSVRLTGDLDTLDQVITAESIAAGTPGVRRVYNDLRVKPRI